MSDYIPNNTAPIPQPAQTPVPQPTLSPSDYLDYQRLKADERQRQADRLTKLESENLDLKARIDALEAAGAGKPSKSGKPGEEEEAEKPAAKLKSFRQQPQPPRVVKSRFF